jgi:hypothetical protein
VGFADLLRAVAGVDGIERIRFTSPYPLDFSDDVIAAMAETPKVCRHVHLPLQAASDAVLARMRRGYTYAEFRRLAGALRAAMPSLAITTDLLVASATRPRTSSTNAARPENCGRAHSRRLLERAGTPPREDARHRPAPRQTAALAGDHAPAAHHGRIIAAQIGGPNACWSSTAQALGGRIPGPHGRLDR